MPGDPTRLFTVPGQPEEARNEICVSFGLCKRVPTEGNAYETGFDTGVDGPYSIHAYFNDTNGNSEIAHFSHTKMKSYSITDPVKIQLISFDQQDTWKYRPGETITITVWVLPQEINNTTVTTELQDEFGVRLPSSSKSMIRNGSTNNFTVTYTAPSAGVYIVNITANDTSVSTEDYVHVGFSINDWQSVNPYRIGTFELVEDEFESYQQTDRSAYLAVSVISSAGSLNNIDIKIRIPPPIIAIQDRVAIHPDEVVTRSILEQFGSYFVNMLTFNLGNSFLTGRPIVDEMSVRIGPTILLFGTSTIISYILGILIGAVIAWRRGSKLELGTIVVTLFFYAMPVFWLALVLLWIFAVNINLFPLAGMGGFDTENNVPLTGLDYAADVLWHMALPLTTLVAISLAGSILLMRSNMLEVMGEDYVTTAKAKGLKERSVVYKHAARNALLPVVTALAISIGFTISGGVLTETVFSWPGMGSYLVSRTLAQDFPAVQGAFFILAIITIIANMVADILYAYLDPRVRL
ncbi:MAG: hypothetical protein AM326_11945 [Candidatus Thorarchaeota archaeon SMTZ-45]|nr:MAG: hypothetical protein AM326_11945 [Candidatus Thorarchaeota archaeon SMTZ-45]